MPNKFVRYSIILLSLVLIIGVRFFENKLFYDPFLQFFKSEYQNEIVPTFDGFKLISNIFLRYFINSLLSIAIIYLLFLNKTHVKIAIFLYLILFVILISVFTYLVFGTSKPDYLVLFYVRRFLIQPLFLLLFIPAFYFQKKTA